LESRKRRRKAEEALDRVLAEFHAEVKRELATVRDKRERRWADRQMARLAQRLRMERERKAGEVAPAVAAGEGDAWAVPASLSEGMEVYVRSLAREGRVSAVRGNQVEVILGRVPFTVRREDLRVRAAAAPGAPVARNATRADRPYSVEVRAGGEQTPREIKLIGMRVDVALPELDKYIDDAALAGHTEVRVVHGHGTGRLRAAVRRFLDEHPQVADQRPGKRHEGGDGATVVRLR
jgi:DNA mismatch repair protein MutS2